MSLNTVKLAGWPATEGEGPGEPRTGPRDYRPMRSGNWFGLLVSAQGHGIVVSDRSRRSSMPARGIVMTKFGFSQDLNSNNTVAWIWQDGVMTDLNTLIPRGSPWFLIEALGINDRAQIAGPAFNTSTGDCHGYLATPCGKGNEGCRDEAASPTMARRNNSTLTVAQRLAIRRMMTRSRMRFAQGYHISGLGTPRN